MVTDRQVRELMKLKEKERTLLTAAVKSGMDVKTARKYLRLGKLPSQVKSPHVWRTREDPFAEIWIEAKEFLSLNPGLEAKSLFEHFQQEHPGLFLDGQLRTFQRKVKCWRALEGPGQEVFFPQEHHPGDISESDFTCMNSPGGMLRSSDLPFCADVFQLGSRNDLFFRKLREFKRGAAECVMGVGGSASSAPNGPVVSCGTQGMQPRGVYHTLPGLVTAL